MKTVEKDEDRKKIRIIEKMINVEKTRVEER